MSLRIELLAFLNDMENEVQMAAVDPDETFLGNEPEIIDKIRQTISVVQKIYPMIQVIDEVMSADISPALFHVRWKKVEAQLNYMNAEIAQGDIGSEVTNLLGKFGNDGEGA